MQCTGHSLLAFRSILHASPNGSALQVLTPANRFPRLASQGGSCGNQSMRTAGGWEKGEGQTSFAKPMDLECATDSNYGMLQSGKSARLQLLSVTPVDSDCSCHTDWEWLLLIWVSLILCHLCNQFSTLNPILMTCILVTAALIQWWSTHMWLRRPSVCESATIFNTAFCRKRQAASGKGESGWRADSVQDWFL